MKAEGVEFKVFSNFEIDIDPFKCTVYLVEDYREPLYIDGVKRRLKDIGTEVDLFAVDLKKKTLGAEDLAGKVQDFYDKLETDFKGYELDIEGVEARLMEKIQVDAYADSEAEVQDKVLVDKMQALGRAEHLEKSLAEEIVDKFDQEAIKELFASLQEVKLPKEKLDILMKAVNTICDETHKQGITTNADILIPVLMVALIRSQPERLISDLRYIQRFRNHSKLTGSVAYHLTNILAVVSLIESAKVDSINEKGESIYSLVSRSTSNLQLEGEKTQPESPSMLLRPLTELSNAFSKVTFYPRALSSAVVDTFRRSRASDEPLTAKPVGSKWLEKKQKHPETGQDIEEHLEIRAFRHRIMGLEKFDDLSIKEIPIVFADYKKLLMTYCFEPGKDK